MQVINRPFYITWEILERSESHPGRELRAVKASELHADTLLEEAESDIIGDLGSDPEFDEYGIMNTDKSNVNTFDNPANQRLTADEIQALKTDGIFKPREIIAKIMSSHSTLDQKTAFSLAKYTLRKQKKHIKQFTILPLDVAMMTDWMMSERDFSKIMEIRNEVLSLIGSWANIHTSSNAEDEEGLPVSASRYLVVDDTGGLVVAAIAERMGMLHHDSISQPSDTTEAVGNNDEGSTEADQEETKHDRKPRRFPQVQLPKCNTIHMVYSNSQPNLSLLRYFHFDSNIVPNLADPSPHPLYAHLKPLSWLQLIEPESDSAYLEPPFKNPEELYTMKSNARSAYHRKRRRWERCKSIVDETRAGGFDALVMATYTNPLSILHQLVPLLTGGAQIVVYHPNIEPLTEICDAYSTARRTAFLNLDEVEREQQLGSIKFPVDPTLTLGFTIHTVRAKKWQVLPGRTHPLMTGKGGAEGYVATATRVLPHKGKIQARGKHLRKPKKSVVNGNIVVETEHIETHNSSSDEEQSKPKRLKVDDTTEEVDILVQVS